jgi:hypothetical protein
MSPALLGRIDGKSFEDRPCSRCGSVVPHLWVPHFSRTALGVALMAIQWLATEHRCRAVKESKPNVEARA